MAQARGRTARRTHTFTESVIREMTRVARKYAAVNLAQGFPGTLLERSKKNVKKTTPAYMPKVSQNYPKTCKINF